MAVIRRTTLLVKGQSCDRPQCAGWIKAGTLGYHARLRDDMYCSPECRERHTRLLLQSRRRQEVPAQRRYERSAKLKAKYGIDQIEWDRLYDHQLGRCPICLIALAESTVHVDHDHDTNEVRGLLCRHCNPGLGYFKDSPKILRRAADYLEAQSAVVGEEVTDTDVN